MRRFALSTLAVALTLATASLAAAQQPQQPPAQQHQWSQRPGRAQRLRQRGRRALFRGIKLTAQEKAQVKAINQKYAQQVKPIRESLRPVMQQIRTDRQKGDSSAARAAFAQTRSQREQMRSLRQQELKDIRAVLTPAQQKTFDRNVDRVQARVQRWQEHRQERLQGAHKGA